MKDTNILFTKDCIQSASQLTETTYYNICNGTISHVPYGVLDFCAFFMLLGLLFGVIIFLIKSIMDF